MGYCTQKAVEAFADSATLMESVSGIASIAF